MKGIENNKKAMYMTTTTAPKYAALVELGKDNVKAFNKAYDERHVLPAEDCNGYYALTREVDATAAAIDMLGKVAYHVFGVAYDDYQQDIHKGVE